VNGALEGPDGDLLQTEAITYSFRWFLAPMFWLLQPLFRRQKHDILHDDTQLLERVYQLDQRGFQRTEVAAPKIVVYGGAGFFGSIVVEELLAHTGAHLVVAGRDPDTSRFPKHAGRVSYYESDLADHTGVGETIAGAQLAIDCSGPFQGHTLNLLRACIERRVNYIDVADDRDFVVRAHSLKDEIERAGITALVGCSVVPGISSLLLEHARAQLGALREARICITPGTRQPRGPGSFLCLLSTVGEPYQIPRRGGTRVVHGWSGRERIEFPPPLGARYAYYVVDVADYFVQPQLFGVDSVDFKIASELDSLNRLLGALRWMRQTFGMRSLNWTMPLARIIVGEAAVFGTTNGAVLVEAESRDGKRMSLCVLAADHGERIPSLLPAIAAERMLCGQLQQRGIVSAPGWLNFKELARELSKRGVQVSERIGTGDWRAVSQTAQTSPTSCPTLIR
jgi:hypothetical protein